MKNPFTGIINAQVLTAVKNAEQRHYAELRKQAGRTSGIIQPTAPAPVAPKQPATVAGNASRQHRDALHPDDAAALRVFLMRQSPAQRQTARAKAKRADVTYCWEPQRPARKSKIH